jgi:hypothetical protein
MQLIHRDGLKIKATTILRENFPKNDFTIYLFNFINKVVYLN